MTSALAVMVLIFVGVFGYRLYDAVSHLRAAPEDNVQWTMSQLEVDVLRFATAMQNEAGGEADLAKVRKRFDIFYSRVGTLSRGRVFSELRNSETARVALAKLEEYLSQTVPVIDGPDDDLRAVIPQLFAGTEELRATARTLSLSGVDLFARASDERRAEFERLLLTAALIAVSLILLLVLTLVVLYRQFTVARLREGEVRRGNERLASTINAALDAIIVIDENGTVLDMNAAAETVFGYSRASAIGVAMDELIVPEQYIEAHRAGMDRFRRTGQKNVTDKGRIELSAKRADGTEFPVELSIGSSSGKSGSIFIAYLRDISQRVAAQTALTEALDNAMAADRAKSEFIAVMSHEMRTPLNGLLGVLDLMRSTGLKDRQRQYLDVAVSSGEILLRHVNDVLDIAQLESGRLELESEPLDMGAIVAGVADVNRPIAETNGVPILTHVETPAAIVAGDTHRLRQVLLNLVGNAVKFTSEGQVSIDVSVAGEDAEEADFELTVTDTGVGIAETDLERIFEDFVTVDPSYNRRFPGTGLGLAVCRRLVTAMGGTISVDSTPGKGSRFSVRLRLPKVLGASCDIDTDTGDEQVTENKNLDILLVEDNEINRFVAREMLQRAGHIVLEATNGREGVDMAEASTFDLILMDISMPGMNGMEATRAIRAGSGPNRRTPIVGLTAHVLPAEHEKFIEAGMQECLTKPIRIETLEETLERIAAPEGPQTGRAQPTAEIPLIDAEVFDQLAASIPTESFADTVRKICNDIDRSASRLTQGDVNDDLDEIATRVHRMAGSAAVVGASALQALLARIETAAKSDDLDAVDHGMKELPETAQNTVVELRDLIAEHND